MSVYKYDAIIIGSGAAGAVCADSLTDAGLKVCCIEKGGWANPDDYPSTHIGWEIYKRSSYSFDPNIRQNPADYFIDSSGSPIDVANFCGVGGSTVLFSGHYPRFHPHDFRVASADGVGCDWPFSYSELQPYYVANEKFLGVAGKPGDPMYPDTMRHLKDPVPLGRCGEKITQAYNDFGWHCWPSYSAILTAPHNGRPACTNSGPCNTGCHNGAKGSSDVTFIKAALGRGLELKTNCTVSRVIVVKQVARGVEILDESGKTRFLEADKVFLAANAVGSCRVLWSSCDKGYLGDSSGQVGKNFMIHPLGYVEGLLSGCDDAHIGPQGSWLASHEFCETNKGSGFIRGYSMHWLKGAGPSELAYNAVLRGRLQLGRSDFLENLKIRLANTVACAIVCEDLPSYNNSITMKTERADDGLPVPRVQYHLDGNTKKMMAHGMTQAKHILRAAGANDVFGSGPVRFAGWHLTGTTKMGVDPKSSVVGPSCQMHDIENLFIVDGGVMPSSSGVNPAATIQAVARKASEEMIKNER